MGAYADVLNRVFEEAFSDGDRTVEFSMTDLRNAAQALDLEIRNPPDIIAHFRSRNDLPEENYNPWPLGFGECK